MRVGIRHTDLTRDLIGEVMQSHEDRVDSLRKFYPEAKDEDWQLAIAGQRVQIIKKDKALGGKLEFGTEVSTSKDGSLAALLGASPGASTAVDTMIGIIETCFKKELETDQWQDKLREMIPSYKQSLIDDEILLSEIRGYTLISLKLKY